MTIAGIVTLVGILLTLVALIRRNVEWRVWVAWGTMLLLFIVVNLTHFTGVQNGLHDLIYLAVALPCLTTVLFVFFSRLHSCTGLFAAGFVFTSLGNLYDLDAFKVATVDVLDVMVWVQLAMLFVMTSHKHQPAEGRNGDDDSGSVGAMRVRLTAAEETATHGPNVLELRRRRAHSQ